MAVALSWIVRRECQLYSARQVRGFDVSQQVDAAHLDLDAAAGVSSKFACFVAEQSSERTLVSSLDHWQEKV
jgi:hypothetical protein